MDCFETNLMALSERSSVLADYIQELDLPANISMVRSHSGLPTLRIVDGQGQSRFLHSPNNPESEVKYLLKDHTFPGRTGPSFLDLGWDIS